MGPRDVALAISVPVIWGSGFVIAKVALDGFPAILLMAMRFTVTAAVLVWFFRPPVRLWGKLFIIALISGSVQYSLTFNGLKQIDASTAGLIVQTEVPFAALIAAVFLKEKVTLKTIGGLALALIGVAVIFGDPQRGPGGLDCGRLYGHSHDRHCLRDMVRFAGPLSG